MSFTADHDTPIARGGKLVGQVLVPLHRRCDSRMDDDAPVEICELTSV